MAEKGGRAEQIFPHPFNVGLIAYQLAAIPLTPTQALLLRISISYFVDNFSIRLYSAGPSHQARNPEFHTSPLSPTLSPTSLALAALDLEPRTCSIPHQIPILRVVVAYLVPDPIRTPTLLPPLPTKVSSQKWATYDKYPSASGPQQQAY